MVHSVEFFICIYLLFRSPAKVQAHEVADLDDNDEEEIVDILLGGEEADEEMNLPEGGDDDDDDDVKLVENPVVMEKKRKYSRKRSAKKDLPVVEVGQQLQQFIWREEGIGRVTYFTSHNLMIAGRI